MAGRPLKLTPELVERIGELRRDGYTVAEVAETLGLSARSVQYATARLRERAEPVTSEAELTAAIARAANFDWRAAKYLLERLHGPGVRGAARDHEPAGNELAELRRLHRRLEGQR
jgi:hypothetical protein